MELLSMLTDAGQQILPHWFACQRASQQMFGTPCRTLTAPVSRSRPDAITPPIEHLPSLPSTSSARFFVVFFPAVSVSCPLINHAPVPFWIVFGETSVRVAS